MMLPTHISSGLLIAGIFSHIFPEYTSVFLIAIVIGSILPDLDLIIGTHRKTLHYPIYSLLGVVISAGISPLFTGVYGVILVGFFIGVFQHSISDVLGGGVEEKPWERTSDKAVYSHYNDKWLPPTYHLGYDGSLKDVFALTILLILSWMLLPYNQYVTGFILLLFVIGVLYASVRKLLPRLSIYLYKKFPFLKPIITLIYDENRGQEEIKQ